MKSVQQIGRSLHQLHGHDLVTGRAKYGTDYRLKGILYGKIKRSPYPHALIKSVDLAKALRLPGVRAVISGRDLQQKNPHGSVSIGVHDNQLLARERVRYVGEPIVAVAAESLETAEEAMEAIEISYEPLESLFDPKRSLGPNQEVKLHPEILQYDVTGKKPFYPRLEPDMPNVSAYLRIRHGNMEDGMKRADLTVENTFTLPRVQHLHLEPISSIAQATGEEVSIIASTQEVEVRDLVAEALSMGPSKVKLTIPRHIGGGFGNRAALHSEGIAALLSRISGKPVFISLTREEIFTATSVRHPAIISIKDGVTKEGKILARKMMIIFDGGAYSPQGSAVVRNSGIAAASTYAIPNLTVDAYRVYTNHVPAGSMRGYGGPQMDFAMEVQMDDIARRIGKDPVEIRLENLLKSGQTSALGEMMESVNGEGCLQEVARAIGWPKRRPANTPWLMGKGLAIAEKWSHANFKSRVKLVLKRDGSLEIDSAIVDIGEGSHTAMVQLVAQELGLDPSKISLMPVSEGSPHSTGAAGSRQTFNTGNALIYASRLMKEKLRDGAAACLGCLSSEVTIDGALKIFSGPRGASVTLAQLHERSSGDFVVEGEWILEGGELHYETGKSSTSRVVAHYTSAAASAEVAVNTETGEVRILQLHGAVDVGKAINPATVTGQIQGSLIMGMGYALSEELVVVDGKIANADLKDYKIISSLEAPRTSGIILETPHPAGPYGAKGCGEAPLSPVAPAIVNAVSDATGIKITSLPLTREKILLGLER